MAAGSGASGHRGGQAGQAESGLVHVTTLAATAMINSHLFESLREKSAIPRHPDGRSGAVVWSCSRAKVALAWKSLMPSHLCTAWRRFCHCSGVSSKQTWTGMWGSQQHGSSYRGTSDIIYSTEACCPSFSIETVGWHEAGLVR